MAKSAVWILGLGHRVRRGTPWTLAGPDLVLRSARDWRLDNTLAHAMLLPMRAQRSLRRFKMTGRLSNVR